MLVRCGRTLKRRRTRQSLNIPKKPLSPTPRPEAVAVNAILPTQGTFVLVEMGLGSVLAELPDSSSSENEDPTEETRFCTVNLNATSSDEDDEPTEETPCCTVKPDATSVDESSHFGCLLYTSDAADE